MNSLSHSANVSLTLAGEAPQHFADPYAVFTAETPADAWHTLARVEELLAEGYAVAGFLSYELAYTCVDLPEPRHRDAARALPYLVLGAFAPPPCDAPEQRTHAAFAYDALRPQTAYDDYRASLAKITCSLRAGDYYQVNLSVPFDFRYTGDSRAGFERLARTSGARHAAYLRFGDTALMSLSPELFLRFDRDRIVTKPMKGTAAVDCAHDLHSQKNRAEHVMIVDLLRNDLARVCTRVQVDALFAEELYPTFVTLTSTIAGVRRLGMPFHEIIRALFPCGSITGAPKRAAVAAIAQLETTPRDAYCGTIGFLLPDGTGEWNVAIRTAQLNERRRTGRLHLGGGIVADSHVADEWHELAVKGRFFETTKFTTYDRV